MVPIPILGLKNAIYRTGNKVGSLDPFDTLPIEGRQGSIIKLGVSLRPTNHHKAKLVLG